MYSRAGLEEGACPRRATIGFGQANCGEGFSWAGSARQRSHPQRAGAQAIAGHARWARFLVCACCP
jgi:hypothetical protein